MTFEGGLLPERALQLCLDMDRDGIGFFAWGFLLFIICSFLRTCIAFVITIVNQKSFSLLTLCSCAFPLCVYVPFMWSHFRLTDDNYVCMVIKVIIFYQVPTGSLHELLL